MKLVNIHKLLIVLVVFLIGDHTVKAQIWTLQQCIDSAQVNNKNLQMSKNNKEISKQKNKEATAYLLPKITANTDYKYFTNLPYQLMPMSVFNPAIPEGQFKEAQFGVPHNINANLQLEMPLYNPQIYGGIQATKIASELSELQYQKTEEQIIFEISELYYNAQILYHQINFIDSNLINAERLLKNIQLLQEQLLAKGTDVNKVKLQVSQLTNQKENILSKYDQVLNMLKFTMGISIKKEIQIDPNISFQENKEYLTTNILDVLIIKSQKHLISNELSILNKSRLFPSINLLGTYGTTGYGYDKKPNDFLKFYPIGFAGIQLSYPLFNGTVTQKKIKQKKFELKNSELQITQISEKNDLQIENTKKQRVVAKKSVETSEAQIELAHTIYKQTLLQQAQGTATITDVLLADNTLREAQQIYLTAVIDYLKADLLLRKLAGQLLIKR